MTMQPGEEVTVRCNGFVYQGRLRASYFDCDEGVGGSSTMTIEVALDRASESRAARRAATNKSKAREARERGSRIGRSPAGATFVDAGSLYGSPGDDEYDDFDEEEDEVTKGFKAHLHRDPRRRTTIVSLETPEGKFLTPDGVEHDREMGTEMPVFGSFPDEILKPILHAGRNINFGGTE